jgi:hypothetical protein
MLIGFFRRSFFFQYFLLIFLAGALWAGAFVNPVLPDFDTNHYLMPGYHLVMIVIGDNALISVVLAFLLVLIQAFFLNYILIRNDLVPKNTLIPAMVYLILMSHSRTLLQLHPVIISNLFLIIILFNLFKVYTQEDAYTEIFNAGFLTAVGSFFYFPFLYFILFIWMTFIVYSLYKWRDWLIPFTGLITPYIFLLTYFFWSDELFLVLDAYAGYYSTVAFIPLYLQFSLIDWIIAGIIVLLFLWSFLKLIANIQERIISIRKQYGTIFWLLVVCLLTYMGSGSYANSHLAMIAMPVSIYFSYGFSNIKRKFWIELFFGILTLVILFNSLKEIIT